MNDFSKIVADALDAGQIPWRMSNYPRQIVSGRLFAGVNPILLQIAATKMNSTSLWWATKMQWELCGHTVIVGPEEGVQLPGKEDDEVYNLNQTVGKYPLVPPKPTDPRAAFDTLVERARIKIEPMTDATCEYDRVEDLIRIPYPFMFIGTDCFFHALAHEIGHWSEKRMGWAGNSVKDELRADVLAGHLCAVLGIEPLAARFRQQHDKYVKTWAKDLRANPGLIFTVCDSVTATVAWLLRIIGVEVRWEVAPVSD